jgi:hypothetical protein
LLRCFLIDGVLMYFLSCFIFSGPFSSHIFSNSIYSGPGDCRV